MNNPNPFVPKGSLLEQQSRRRSRMKLAVGCVLAVSILGLLAMLIQGCKREAPTENPEPQLDTNNVMPPMDMGTNPPPMDTNVMAAPVIPAPAPGGNPAAAPAPVVPAPMPVAPEPVANPTPASSSTYEVAQGDTLGKIAKKFGVSLKALEAANPGVDPRRLKVKQKLNIPASTGAAEGAAATPAASDTGGATYVVKSGDNLTKIARHHGVTVKALRAANNLSTDHIKVGQKLIIPGKGESAAPAPAPDASAVPSVPPPVSPTPAPVTPEPTPAPGH